MGDLIEVIVLAMVIGVALCGVTAFLTLRRYLGSRYPLSLGRSDRRDVAREQGNKVIARTGGPGTSTPSRKRLRPGSRSPAPR